MSDKDQVEEQFTEEVQPAPVAPPATPVEDLVQNLKGNPQHRLADVPAVFKVLHPEITDETEIRLAVLEAIEQHLFG